MLNCQLVQKHIMSVTVVEVYSRYKVKFPNNKIGLILFRKPQVKPCKYLKVTYRRSGLCQKCCNAALKAEDLQKNSV